MAVSYAGLFKVASRHLFAGVGVPSLPWGSWKGRRIIKSWGERKLLFVIPYDIQGSKSAERKDITDNGFRQRGR